MDIVAVSTLNTQWSTLEAKIFQRQLFFCSTATMGKLTHSKERTHLLLLPASSTSFLRGSFSEGSKPNCRPHKPLVLNQTLDPVKLWCTRREYEKQDIINPLFCAFALYLNQDGEVQCSSMKMRCWKWRPNHQSHQWFLENVVPLWENLHERRCVLLILGDIFSKENLNNSG